MGDCGRPISEQTIGEAADCAWQAVKSAVQSAFAHPGAATVQDWLITVLAIVAVLLFIGALLPRRRY